MNTQLKFVAIATLAVLSQAALAQSAGTWMVRAGATTITPQNPSKNLSAPSLPNSKTDVGAASQVSGGITYMVTDNVSIDLPLAAPFTHKLSGAGALAGVGQVGEVQALPVTVLAQYRFMEPKSTFRPYVGLGVTYAYFFNEKGSGTLTALTNPGGPPTTLKIDSQYVLTPQIGATMAFGDKWFVDLCYSKTMMTVTTKLSTGQSVEADLNPDTVSLSVGYKF